MFIKKVTKTNGKTKKKYHYLHLVESVRTERGPRQRLVLNLGAIDVDPSQYQSLASRIEEILTGQGNFVQLADSLEKHAQEASSKILQKQAEELDHSSPSDYKMVDVNSLRTSEARSLGPEYVCHSIWEELGLDAFLSNRGISDHVLPLIKSLVINRLVMPGSERFTKWWAEHKSAIYELTGFPRNHSLNSYYRAGDRLYEVKEALETHLSRKEKDMFSLSEKYIFIDLTNSYFEGEAEKNPKAKRGHSKDKRHDCKLLTIGMIVDEFGFAKTSEYFAGNQNEPKTLEEMIEVLEKKDNSAGKDRTVVMDAGLATKKNIEWLKQKGYHYLCIEKNKLPVSLEDSEFKVIREDSSQDLRVEVKRYEEEEETYLLCRSSQREAKERGIRSRMEKLLVEQLQHYREGLNIPRRTKKYKSLLEKIGRLKEKYPKASKLYDIEVIPEDNQEEVNDNTKAKDIVWEKKEQTYEEEIISEGKYLLKTDRKDLEDEEIWNI